MAAAVRSAALLSAGRRFAHRSALRVTALLAGLLCASAVLTGCGATAPSFAADPQPYALLDTAVVWTETARLFGQEGGGSGRAASIVGMELRYAAGADPDRATDPLPRGAWYWVLTRTMSDRGGDADPAVGIEQTWEATSGRFIAEREIDLAPAERTGPAVTPLRVSEIVGEQYPSPRIVRMRLDGTGGVRTWVVLLYDEETGTSTTARIDATSGARL